MKALLIKDVNNYYIADVDRPDPTDGEILIRVKYASLCGSDKHLIRGEFPTAKYPIIPGHEFSGVVEKVSNGNETLLGKFVTCNIMLPCKKCAACKLGDMKKCSDPEEIGFKRNGAFCQYIRVPASSIIELDPNIGESSCLVELVAVALYTIKKMAIGKNEDILITGAGSLGGTMAFVLSLSGYRSITICDRDINKLSRIGKINNLKTIKSKTIVEMMRGMDRPLKIIETTGAPFIFERLLKSCPVSSNIGVLGYSDNDVKLKIGDILLKNLKIMAIIGPKDVWKDAAEFVKKNREIGSLLISHRYEIDQINDAVDNFLNFEPHKIVVRFS